MLHTIKNIKHIFLAVLLVKLYMLMINLANCLVLTEGKNTIESFIKAIPEEINYCKKVKKE